MSVTTSQPSAPRPDDKGTAPVERGGFLSRFTVLLHAPRELWLALTIKFLMFSAYGLTNFTIKLWLSSDFGYSDKQALALVGAWSLAMTAVTLLVLDLPGTGPLDPVRGAFAAAFRPIRAGGTDQSAALQRSAT